MSRVYWDQKYRAEIERQLVEIKRRLEQGEQRYKQLLEYADELRVYTHDWDWKYGEAWDKERAALSEPTQLSTTGEDDAKSGTTSTERHP